MEQKPDEKLTGIWFKAKVAYDQCVRDGMLLRLYPELTMDWDDDKDFWFEEYCEQMERMKNR